MWMMQYVRAICVRLDEDADMTLRAAATTAYDDVLCVHHSWWRAQAVRAALLLAPSRASFEEQLSPENVRALAQLIHTPTRALEVFFDEHGGGDLP